MKKHIDGWNAQTEYACEFEHAGSKWATNIFAVDDADAEAKVKSLKESIVLLGPIDLIIPANSPA